MWREHDNVFIVCFSFVSSRRLVSRLSTHYLCRSSEGLDNGLEVEVIDKEEEVGKGKAHKAEDDGSEMG
jgi:hypothetical protein